jgi:hypothetical protein
MAVGGRLPDPRNARRPEGKDCILPLVFLERLSDVFDDEVAHPAPQRVE